MYFRFLLALLLSVGLCAGASAQNTAQPVITGYLTTSGCPSPALTPCFVQYGTGGSGPGSNVVITGPLGQAAMAASIPVTIASNQANVPVSQATASALNATVVGTGTFAVQATVNLAQVGGSNVSLGQQVKAASIPVAIASDQTVPVTEAPTAVAPTVGASGAITSLVLKGSATTATGGVKSFHAENATTTGGYCILYNATAAPGTGALTANLVLNFQLLPASGYCDWQANSVDPPIAASIGAVLLVSSGATPYTYTTGAVTASMKGLAQ